MPKTIFVLGGLPGGLLFPRQGTFDQVMDRMTLEEVVTRLQTNEVDVTHAEERVAELWLLLHNNPTLEDQPAWVTPCTSPQAPALEPGDQVIWVTWPWQMLASLETPGTATPPVESLRESVLCWCITIVARSEVAKPPQYDN